MRVEEIKRGYSILSGVILFSSFKQFISYFIYMSVIVALLYIIGQFSDVNIVGGRGVLLIITGSLVSVYLSMPVSFIVKNVAVRDIISIVEHKIIVLGYREKEKFSGMYISKLPRILSWDENHIKISKVSDGVRVSGARLPVVKIWKYLRSKETISV
jgi:hypothetical protein